MMDAELMKPVSALEMAELQSALRGFPQAGVVRRMAFEIERLREGRFKPEELQNLCHNLSEDEYTAFCDGCDAYQKKLFGKCRSEESKPTACEATFGGVYPTGGPIKRC